MIKTLIFSQNNPIQLRLLLKSIEKNFNGERNITILFKSTSTEINNQYSHLINENIIENITWIEENKIKDDILKILNESNSDYTCFLTDSDIIYKSFIINDIINALKEDDSILTFSLRLGLNISHCHNLNCNNVIIPLEQNDKYLKWDWSKHYGDFGYPFSMNGHIFRTKEILKLIKNIRFNDIYTLEESIQIYDNYPKEKMISFLNSVLVSCILNQTENSQLIDFEKNINIESINFDKIESCYKKI